MTKLDVTWDDAAESIVRLDVHADYTWDEFYAAVAQVSALVAGKPHRVDMLVNLGRYSAESSGIGAIQKALAALGELPQNTGLVVLVVPPLAGMLLSAARRMDERVGERVRTASTLDKARDILTQGRASAGLQRPIHPGTDVQHG